MKKTLTLLKSIYSSMEVHIKMLALLLACMSFINWDINPAHWNTLCRTIVIVVTLIAAQLIQVIAYLANQKKQKQ